MPTSPRPPCSPLLAAPAAPAALQTTRDDDDRAFVEKFDAGREAEQAAAKQRANAMVEQLFASLEEVNLDAMNERED